MGPIRRKRRRNSFRQKTKVNFTAILVIISIAVLLGYGTAKFIIYPLFNSDSTNSDSTNKEGFKIEKFLGFFLDDKDNPGESDKNNQNNGQSTTTPGIQQNNQDAKSGVVEDKLKVTPTAQNAATTTPAGYCIQFGSFTTKLSAESLVSELKTSGITAQVVEKDGAYKVVSQLFEQKEQAVATMNTLTGTKYSDAFITQR
ncbi:SPOR domain-containing protein [Aminipila terrae]|uniref:SPOR domain-containing protein n=1 Tax=Aminipila terrae TaxID=2697030 RepID=A0A6P1MB27_9FIRM|nr:SPOR domain-containing protein [Aminipila terrae]QHI71061.1 hypothetical protein Ami3637_00470 [Aminipila terrae]